MTHGDLDATILCMAPPRSRRRSPRHPRRLGAAAALALAATTCLTSPAATAAPSTATTPTAARPGVAAAADDTGLLAFVRKNQIYTATQTGGSLRRLTSAAKNFRPHWSPDGTRIAYVHEEPGNVRDIWVMDADGSDQQQVTHVGNASEPAWSPDGAWLAFGGGENPLAYPGAAGGGVLQRIASTAPFGEPVAFAPDPRYGEPLLPVVAGTLDWSRDGGRIVYASDYYPDSPDHYLLAYDIAAGTIDEVGSVGGSCCGEGYLVDPTWTPDSASVLLTYLVTDLGDPDPAGPHLAVLGTRQLPTQSYPDVIGDRDPDYSPSGGRLVFSHWSRIWTSAADGTGRRLVTQGYHPDWQPRT